MGRKRKRLDPSHSTIKDTTDHNNSNTSDVVNQEPQDMNIDPLNAGTPQVMNIPNSLTLYKPTNQVPRLINHPLPATSTEMSVVKTQPKVHKKGLEITSSEFDHRPTRNLELKLKSGSKEAPSSSTNSEQDRPISPRNIHPCVYMDHDKLLDPTKITHYINDVNYVRLYKYLEPIITSQNRGIDLTPEEIQTVESFHCPLSPIHLGDAEFIFYWIRNWILYEEYAIVALKDYLIQQNEKQNLSMRVVTRSVNVPSKLLQPKDDSSQSSKIVPDAKIHAVIKENLAKDDDHELLDPTKITHYRDDVNYVDLYKFLEAVIQGTDARSLNLSAQEIRKISSFRCPLLPNNLRDAENIFHWIRSWIMNHKHHEMSLADYLMDQNVKKSPAMTIDYSSIVPSTESCDVVYTEGDQFLSSKDSGNDSVRKIVGPPLNCDSNPELNAAHIKLLKKEFMSHLFQLLKSKPFEWEPVTVEEQEEIAEWNCPVIPVRSGHVRLIMDWIMDWKMRNRNSTQKSNNSEDVVAHILNENKNWNGIGGQMKISVSCEGEITASSELEASQPDDTIVGKHLVVSNNDIVKKNISRSLPIKPDTNTNSQKMNEISKYEEGGFIGEKEADNYEMEEELIADWEAQKDDIPNESEEDQVDLDKIITVCEEYINNDELAPTVHRRYGESLRDYKIRVDKIWDDCKIERTVKGGPKGYSVQHYVDGKWWPKKSFFNRRTIFHKDEPYLRLPKMDPNMTNDVVNPDTINQVLIASGCPLMVKKVGHVNLILQWTSEWKTFINSDAEQKEKFAYSTFGKYKTFWSFMRDHNTRHAKDAWSGRRMDSVTPQNKLIQYNRIRDFVTESDVSRWYDEIKSEDDITNSVLYLSETRSDAKTRSTALPISTSSRFSHLWNTNPPLSYAKSESKNEIKWFALSSFQPVFKVLKNMLRYQGEDGDFKSSRIMKKFMNSSKIFKFTNSEGKIVQIIGINGRIGVVDAQGAWDFACCEEKCWIVGRFGGFCSAHTILKMSFTLIVMDVKNSNHCYAVFPGWFPQNEKIRKDSPNIEISDAETEARFLIQLQYKSTNEYYQSMNIIQYQTSRQVAGYEVKWKIVKKFTQLTHSESLTLASSIRILLHILFAINNANEDDPSKKIKLLDRHVQYLPNKSCIESIYQSLEKHGITVKLGESSPLGLLDWPPGIRKDHVLSVDDMVTYCRFGTVGRLYGGKNLGGISYQGTKQYIRWSHKTFKGLPVHINSSNKDDNIRKIELETKESQFITLLVFAVMLGAEIDGIPLELDNVMFECLDDWTKKDLEWMQTIFAFLFGKELKITKSQQVNVEQMNWEDLFKCCTNK